MMILGLFWTSDLYYGSGDDGSICDTFWYCSYGSSEVGTTTAMSCWLVLS